MTNETPVPNRELETLLERGRRIRRVPDVVRARALWRARATVATAAGPAGRKPALEEEASTTAPLVNPPASLRGRGLRIAVAASIALAVGATAAGAALRAWAPRPIAPESRPSSPPPPTKARAAAPSAVTPAAPEPPPMARRHHLARVVTPQESYRNELDLLQRAHVAYAAHEFSGALVLVAEHARRFPNGRLAEEREALRIRSLAGSGREDEARRATAQFAVRFPRSVLLPRLLQTADAPE